MSTEHIPFLDLVTPHQELEEELVTVFRSALKTAAFIGGPMVEAFEHDFAAFCGVEHCIGVGSGTDALRFALIAAGVRPGDAVITVPNTFIATSEAITQAGAVPEFVDVDERTYNLDPEKLRQHLEDGCESDGSGGRISRRTGRRVTAVVPVHLYGQMADMDSILALAEAHKLMVIEDACQAHGAEYYSRKDQRWQRAGSMGRAAAFSFYPGKNLGACGEAGAVTTNDPAIAHCVRQLRDHGQAKKYYHDMEGYNGRLDSIQAGIVAAKLKRLQDWNRQRRDRADVYRQLFLRESADIILPHEPSWAQAIYHLYVVRVRNRGQLQSWLGEAHVGSAVHYPIPLHLQSAYAHLGYTQGDFPITERVTSEILSLPMYPTLRDDQQRHVVKSICRFIATAVSPAEVASCSE